MNTLVLNKIESLPAEQQREVENYVQFLVDKFVVKQKPVDPTVVDNRRKAFTKLDEKVFNSQDF